MAETIINSMNDSSHKSKSSPLSSDNSDNNMPGTKSAIAVDEILSRIHCFRVYDHNEQVSLIHQLEDFLASHPKV